MYVCMYVCRNFGELRHDEIAYYDPSEVMQQISEGEGKSYIHILRTYIRSNHLKCSVGYNVFELKTPGVSRRLRILRPIHIHTHT